MVSADPSGRSGRRPAGPPADEGLVADALHRAVADLPTPRVDVHRIRRRARARGVLVAGGVGTALAGAFATLALALPDTGPEVRPVVAGATATAEPTPVSSAPVRPSSPTPAPRPAASAPPPAPVPAPSPAASPTTSSTMPPAADTLVPADEVARVVPVPDGAVPGPCRVVTGGEPAVRVLVITTARVLIQPTLDDINAGLDAWGQPPYVPTDDEIADWVDADGIVADLAPVDVVDCDGTVGIRGPGADGIAALLRGEAAEVSPSTG